MQKFLLGSALFFLFLHVAVAQSKDYAFSAGYSAVPADIATLTGGRQLVVTLGSEFQSDSVFALIVKSDGTPPAHFAIKSFNYDPIVGMHAFETPDGGFVLMIETFECDVFGPSSLLKYDINGQLEWSNSDIPVYAYVTTVPNKVEIAPDGNLIGLVGSKVYKYNIHTGNIMWSKTMFASLPFSTYDFTLIPGTEDFMAVGVPTLQRWRATGPANNPYYTLESDTVLTPNPNVATIQKGLDEWYYAYDSNTKKIVRFKATGWSTELVYTSGFYLSTIRVLPDGLLLLGKPATGYQIRKIGFSGQDLGQYDLNAPWRTPRSCMPMGDSILITGTNESGINKGPTLTHFAKDIWLRIIPKISAINSIDSTDAAITAVEQNLGIQVDTFSYYGTKYNVSGGKFRVQVTNKGITTLHSVTVRTVFNYVIYGCPSLPSKTVVYTGLNIAPQASVWLNFGDVKASYQDSIPTAFCFWTSAPNDRPDADHTNDIFCTPVYKVNCTAPTVHCKKSVTRQILPSGIAGLPASTIISAADNCTTSGSFTFSLRRSGFGTGFPLDSAGHPVGTLQFSCSDVGPQSIEAWAKDALGNTNHCQTAITILDPNHYCPADSFTVIVAGRLATELFDGVEDALVTVTGTGGGTSPTSFQFKEYTPSTGILRFDDVPLASDITIRPFKNDNPLNGVSTYDLVLISKHILGTEPLNSPYKIIAADANHNGSVTTADIVTIRKLILGITPNFPFNTSWRFVDKSYLFYDYDNPFQDTFPETRTLLNLATNAVYQDFVAIKVGDVNGSVIPNSLVGAGDRAEGTWVVDLTPREIGAQPIPSLPSTREEGGLIPVPVLDFVGIGDFVWVHFGALEGVLGGQFTVHLDGLEVVDIIPGVGMGLDQFGVFPDAFTTSFDGGGGVVRLDFTVKFRALKAGKISDMMRVSSRITPAEAYGADGRKMDVAFRFHAGDAALVRKGGFKLYQNQPNPFSGQTMIGFYLPEAAETTLTVFDQNGKAVYTRAENFEKGNQAFTLDHVIQGAPGLLYYKVATPTDLAVKKMIAEN